MSRFSVKSILLGIGIGIVFTSIISIIYLAGTDPAKNLSPEDIAKIAEKYNLVKSEDTVKDDITAENTGTGIITAAPTPTLLPEPTLTHAPAITAAPDGDEGSDVVKGTDEVKRPDSEETGQQLVVIKINEGATSEAIASKLYKAGLIDNEMEFVKQLGSMGLEDKIQIGSFKIPKGSSKKEIVHIITK